MPCSAIFYSCVVEFGNSADLTGTQLEVADGAVEHFVPGRDNVCRVRWVQHFFRVQAVEVRHKAQHLVELLMRRQSANQASILRHVCAAASSPV